jgi:hypothetical protein
VFPAVNRLCTALLYWRAGRAAGKTGGFRPGQYTEYLHKAETLRLTALGQAAGAVSAAGARAGREASYILKPYVEDRAIWRGPTKLT